VSEMETLSVTVVIPVRNEERNLPACLAALDGFEEVIVVDSNSCDSTVALAERLGAHVVQFQWNGRFPKKRNWVLQTFPFRTPWVLFLDADEIVTTEVKEELRVALRDTKHAGFWLKYRNYFLDTELKYGLGQRKLALLRVGSGYYEQIEDDRWCDLDMEVHEHPILEGTLGIIAAPLVHMDFRGLHHFIARHNEYSTWETRRYLVLRGNEKTWSMLTRRQKLKYALITHWWFPPSYFLATYFFKRGFLDGWAGFVHAMMKMAYFFQIYCKLRELKAIDQAAARRAQTRPAGQVEIRTLIEGRRSGR
jgi:glycosyltransferase involved in cell wall biosynthesis